MVNQDIRGELVIRDLDKKNILILLFVKIRIRQSVRKERNFQII